jgi:ABC-type branched-subunit amino acid transport system ATPase component
MGSVPGVMIGAAILVLVPEVLRPLAADRYVIVGVVMVVMAILRPQGLWPRRIRAGARSAAPAPRPGDAPVATAPDEGGPEAVPAGETLLACSGVTRRFGGLTAVRDLDLEIPSGGLHGLIGPNGAGKSTLFHMIAGSLKPSEGTITFAGRRVDGLPESRRVGLGIARTFQDTRLFSRLSAIENVLTACRAAGTPPGPLSTALGLSRHRRFERQARAQAEELLRFVGLEHHGDRAAGDLAYGDQRRIAIARALATRPRLLLLDEPAAGLNNAETQQLAELLRAIPGRGVTVLLIEHDMELVMNVCERVTVLEQGHPLMAGDPDAVRTDAAVLNAYLGGGDARASRREQRLRAVAGA